MSKKSDSLPFFVYLLKVPALAMILLFINPPQSYIGFGTIEVSLAVIITFVLALIFIFGCALGVYSVIAARAAHAQKVREQAATAKANAAETV